jgi:fumarylacetoacetase
MLNAGRVFQPGAPPLPNFKWLPIAYHGRASSVEVSGASFHRPHGQWRKAGEPHPWFAPSRAVDYELELGFWVGPGNARGHPIPVSHAEQHVFGVSLLNDWSARDVQGWEAMPLGPFLAKNFLTTVSPWIVTLEALAPFRCALPRGDSDLPPAENLCLPTDGAGFDIELEAWLEPTTGSPVRGSPARLSRSNFRHCHWAVAQMLAHHTEGGCNLRPGDLIGSGTQSGPGDREQGCLLELTHGGQRPLHLRDGFERTYLEDGDTVTLRGWCDRPGAARIGFGECRGTLLPAICGPATPPRGVSFSSATSTT